MYTIPQDLKESLAQGYQFSYDANSSVVGAIELLGLSDLVITNAWCEPHDAIMEIDEYQDCAGYYLIPAFNLVKWSDLYDPIGMLAYFPTFDQYGSFDEDHSTVNLFKRAKWRHIQKNPLKYLEDQWSMRPISYQPIPWPGYDYYFTKFDITLKGYPDVCELHNSRLVKKKKDFQEYTDVDITCDLRVMLETYQREFPYSGQQISTRHELRCEICREKEVEWMHHNTKPKASVPITTNAGGFLKCPSCGIRFKFNDINSFKNGVHRCGQKIDITLSSAYEQS